MCLEIFLSSAVFFDLEHYSITWDPSTEIVQLKCGCLGLVKYHALSAYKPVRRSWSCGYRNPLGLSWYYSASSPVRGVGRIVKDREVGAFVVVARGDIVRVIFADERHAVI